MTQKILLVDDEEMVVNVTKAILEHLGYQVLVARNGREAIETFARCQDDIRVIVMDYGMPELNGYECLHEIRKISNTPALLMTGFGEEFAILERDKNLFQGILSKPFSVDNIQQALQAILPDEDESA